MNYAQEKYFTTHGWNALSKRLETLACLKETVSYPCSFKILGFPELNVDTEQELEQRMKEIKDILNVELVEE